MEQGKKNYQSQEVNQPEKENKNQIPFESKTNLEKESPQEETENEKEVKEPKRGFRRFKKDFSSPRIHSENLEIKRVVKATKGGRRFSFTSLILAKDETKKSVAFAYTGGKEVILAIRKASRKAQKNLVSYFNPPPRTIHRDVEINYKGITLKLFPAPSGTGVKAGGTLSKLFKFLEIKDISAKIIASHHARKNKPNVVRAAFLALDKLSNQKK